MSSENTSAKLTASYESPENESFTITKTIASAPPLSSVEEKTRYLEKLRQAVTESQERINKELTLRMEQDNARASSAHGKSAANLATDEDREEENYGEEAQEEV